jgi:AcrR family transcriptional regulator
MAPDPKSRPYRKKARAANEAETRLRITKAAVELHRTKGPANTSITDVAKLAGVSRMTVYNHYPTEVELFGACSGHWAGENPFPDPGQWAAIEGTSRRLRTALLELYTWYDEKEDMLGKVFRDLPNVPSLQTVMSGFWPGYVDGIIGVLTQDWPIADDQREALRSALELAIDFHTWQVLARSLKSTEKAAELIAMLIEKTFLAS